MVGFGDNRANAVMRFGAGSLGCSQVLHVMFMDGICNMKPVWRVLKG